MKAKVKNMERKLQHNIIKIYLMAFFQSAMVITAIYVPLLQGYGLSMSEVMQTQALFALTIAFCEVPSGYLADLWGRKRAILSGAILCAIGFGMLFFARTFWEFMAYELILGVGISLNSGADLALLYDTQSHLNRNKSNQSCSQHIAKLISLEGLAGAVAAILASLLTLWSLQLVVLVQAIIGLAPVLIAITLVEAPRHISVNGHRDNAQQIKSVITNKPLVLSIALAIIAFNLAAIYGFWLYQKFWESRGIPLSCFGYLWASHCIIRGVAARFANQVEMFLGSQKTLMMIALLNLFGLAGMALCPGLTGVFVAFVLPVARGLSSVILADGLNKRLDGEFRATVNSIVSLGFRGIFIVTGPFLGVLVDHRGVETGLLVLSCILTPVFALVLLFLFNSIKAEKKLLAEMGEQQKTVQAITTHPL